MSNSRDVFITGLGVISPIGLSTPELLSSLQTNKSGIGLWESPLMTKKLPAGVINRNFASDFTKMELPYLDRCSQMALLAARQATNDAGLDQFAHYGQRAGLFYGSVGGGVNTEHDWVRQFYVEHKQLAKPFAIMACMLNAAPAQISIRHQILGPVMTHSSACTSSGAAIGDALRAIRHGYLDVALVGGAEAALIPTFMGLWGGLRALADPNSDGVERSCQPFSKNRTGLVLSEGSVFLVLESREHALERGASCYCALTGYGVASDGYHIGSPNADGQVAALRAALADAALQPAQIDYLNAHATATPGGDPIEASAINTVFDHVPVSSTKGIHGHLLGAASALELATAVLAINQSFLPATAHLDEVDPSCPLNHVANTPVLGHPVRHALSLSAGFGGTNVALIVSAVPDGPIKTNLNTPA
jgi:3-oxoacyl-[acyl-carrier-protein] synthase II